jgi:TonB family protein
MRRMSLTLAWSLFLTLSAGAQQPAQRVNESDARKAILHRVDPEYPLMAKQMHITGKATIEVIVDTEGAVEKVAVVSGNPLLTAAAVNAVKKWKFSPFKADGKSIRAVIQMGFVFTL